MLLLIVGIAVMGDAMFAVIFFFKNIFGFSNVCFLFCALSKKNKQCADSQSMLCSDASYLQVIFNLEFGIRKLKYLE